MASRKRAEQPFYAINEHGTCVLVEPDDFEQRFEPAGYRRLKDDEVAPLQTHEVLLHGDGAAVNVARQQEHGHARFPITPE